MSVYVFWLRKGLSIKYVGNWWGDAGGSYKIRTFAYSGKGVSRLICTYALTLSLVMFLAAFLSYSVLFHL